MRKQLTAAMVEKVAPPPAGRFEIFDAIVPALGLRVTSNGAKSFVVRGRVKGQPASIRVTLGDARYMKLADAREQASDKLRLMRTGIDPRPPKVAKEPELTFDALIDDWVRLGLSRRSESYRDNSPKIIRRNFADMLRKPAANITRADVVNALDRLAHKPGEQAKARSCASACFSWAYKREKVPANLWAGLPDMTPSAARERVLSGDEIRAIWSAAGALGYPWGAFYRLSILTLQRREEVAGMCWSEIDFDKRLWTIPGARMKMSRPHDVHLSAPAIEVLATVPRLDGSDLVFTTTGYSSVSGYSKAKRQLEAAIGETLPQWQPHDFRRTGVSTLAQLGFDVIVADLILAHAPGKLRGVAGVYQRYDFARERAAALDAWAQHVVGLDNVVTLRAIQ
jgi:integrase